MKARILISVIGLVLLFSGCKKETIELPEALTTSKTNLEAAFEALNNHMAAAVDYMISVDMDTSLIRAKLVELVNSQSNVMEFSWVTPDGILEIIEPSVYYPSQGADISRQAHIVKAFDTKKPVLSQQFLAVEGFHAAVLIHPIVSKNKVLGGVTALFIPQDFLGDIMFPLLNKVEYELWVMEKGGRMLFNQDLNEVGLDIFNDPAYKDFPELVTAARLIDDEETGTTHYSFYKTGTTTPVTKLTYWTTIEVGGLEWKLVWVKPE